jgi:hypothetical protein
VLPPKTCRDVHGIAERGGVVAYAFPKGIGRQRTLGGRAIPIAETLGGSRDSSASAVDGLTDEKLMAILTNRLRHRPRTN